MRDKSIQEEIRENIIYLLEDKDAHFTSDWVIAAQILKYLDSKDVRVAEFDGGICHRLERLVEE